MSDIAITHETFTLTDIDLRLMSQGALSITGADRQMAQEITRLRTALSEAEQQIKSLDRLRDVTYAVQHNPNCPAKYLVRLVGKSGRIDFKPYGNGLPRVKHETTDILGFGKTLGEAIDNALADAHALIPSESHDAEARE